MRLIFATSPHIHIIFDSSAWIDNDRLTLYKCTFYEKKIILLKKIRPKVKNIFFHFHDIDGGCQHPFFLTEKTIKFVARDLEFNIKKFRSNKILLIKK